MTDPIYSVSFVVVFDTVIVLVSLLNRMFAFMLHSEYTTSCFMAKRKKEARQDISLFCSEQSLYLRV